MAMSAAEASGSLEDEHERMRKNIEALYSTLGKTQAQPPLYWLPLTDQQVAAKRKEKAAPRGGGGPGRPRRRGGQRRRRGKR